MEVLVLIFSKKAGACVDKPSEDCVGAGAEKGRQQNSTALVVFVCYVDFLHS